jgi:hypothetical protein
MGRISRRGLLGMGGRGLVAAALIGGTADAQSSTAGLRPGPRAIRLRADAFSHFEIRDRDRRDFGLLRFRGGLDLRSDDEHFGGISALRVLDTSGRFLAITDVGSWFEGRLVSDAGRPSAIEQPRMAPALHMSGVALKRTRSYDCESIAIKGDQVFVGVERVNEILRFEWARDGVLARGQPIAVPAEVKRLPNNLGLEALGVMPAGPSSPGSLIGIAERSDGMEAATKGFIIGGPNPGMFRVQRSDRFDITDLDFLPSGDMVLLERRFRYTTGIAMRLRRIPLSNIRPGALLDGPVILAADMGFEIDNMEGLSIHRDAGGQTLFTLISDDNFSILQRTVLLQFAWMGD